MPLVRQVHNKVPPLGLTEVMVAMAAEAVATLGGIGGGGNGGIRAAGAAAAAAAVAAGTICATTIARSKDKLSYATTIAARRGL